MQNEKTIGQLLDEFEAATGKEFVFTGNMKKYNGKWSGEIKSVDRTNMTITGEHGEFSIYCVAIKEEQLPTLKEFQQRKQLHQGNLFT